MWNDPCEGHYYVYFLLWNLWKSKFEALEKPGKLREYFFFYFVATLKIQNSSSCWFPSAPLDLRLIAVNASTTDGCREGIVLFSVCVFVRPSVRLFFHPGMRPALPWNKPVDGISPNWLMMWFGWEMNWLGFWGSKSRSQQGQGQMFEWLVVADGIIHIEAWVLKYRLVLMNVVMKSFKSLWLLSLWFSACYLLCGMVAGLWACWSDPRRQWRSRHCIKRTWLCEKVCRIQNAEGC